MASFPKIYSLALLKDYILKKLGSPVINIELTDDQLGIAIDDTIEEFVTYAYSGVTERFIPMQVTSGIQTYKLPYDVISVLGVHEQQLLGIGSSSVATQPFSVNQFVAADLFAQGGGTVNLLQYELTFEMLATMNLMLGKKETYDFNCYSKYLHLFEMPQTNKNVFVQVYKKLTLEEGDLTFGSTTVTGAETTNLYDHKWVKRMSTERARYQWAVNMMKYSGTVLPNGGNLNVDGILTEAKENIEKLKEELESAYQLPPDFMVGAISLFLIGCSLIHNLLSFCNNFSSII